MARIASYLIVQERNVDSLAEEVNNNIQKGYEPFGSMQIAQRTENSGVSFCQPMVAYLPEKSK